MYIYIYLLSISIKSPLQDQPLVIDQRLIWVSGAGHSTQHWHCKLHLEKSMISMSGFGGIWCDGGKMNHLIILTYCRLYVVYHISYVVIYRYIIYIYISWGVRELSIDMPSKLAKRQPYSQSMKEFKRPHVHKKVAIVHPKKHLMSTKRCLMSTKKVPNIHAFSFHFAATIRKFSDILATSCPHICCQFWQQKSTYSGILTANCPHIGF
jgi:hypothetical protein